MTLAQADQILGKGMIHLIIPQAAVDQTVPGQVGLSVFMVQQHVLMILL